MNMCARNIFQSGWDGGSSTMRKAKKCFKKISFWSLGFFSLPPFIKMQQKSTLAKRDRIYVPTNIFVKHRYLLFREKNSSLRMRFTEKSRVKKVFTAPQLVQMICAGEVHWSTIMHMELVIIAK